MKTDEEENWQSLAELNEMEKDRQRRYEKYIALNGEDRDREEALSEATRHALRKSTEREQILAKKNLDLEASIRETAEEYSNLRESLTSELKKREKQFDNLNKELSERRSTFEIELAKRSEELNEKKKFFEDELLRISEEGQQKLEENTSTFVSNILVDLTEKERKLSNISFWSAIIGGGILVLGLISLVALSFLSQIGLSTDASWPQLIFYAAKGAVIASIIGIISRYAYLFSKEYLREALKVDDRIHAIKFGQLYVETYGAAADWDQVKEAFSNWHGSDNSAEKKEVEAPPVSKNINDADVNLATEFFKSVKALKA